MRLHNRTRRSGATLVEILVVISIITTLSGLSFLSFTAAKRFTDRMDNELANALAKGSPTLREKAKAQPDTAKPDGPPRPRPQKVPGEYYVGFQSSVSDPAAEAQRLARLVGGQVLRVFATTEPGCALKLNGANAALLALDSAVKDMHQAQYVYPAAVPQNIQRVHSNGIRGNALRWNLTVTNQIYAVPPTIYRFRDTTTARPLVTSRVFIPGTTSASVPIAIMDTGIDPTHPDLFVVGARDFTVPQGSPENTADLDGHGTHVAGVVSAAERAPINPVRGVYPGAPLVNLKIMNATVGATSDTPVAPAVGTSNAVLAALDYLIANAGSIRICLLSFEIAGAANPVVDARVDKAANAGVLMVAAAGNLNTMTLPSPANASQAIVVGAIVDTGGDSLPRTPATTEGLTGYTNFGPRLNFLAPGGDAAVSYGIVSTIPVNAVTPPIYSSVNMNGDAVTPRRARGTSFAAAHVAGMMGVMLDPASDIGFIVGNRALPTFRFQMTNKASAVRALTDLTHQRTTVQIINPSGSRSMWQRIVTNFGGVSFTQVVPFTVDFYDDQVGGIPVANFYVNQGDPRAPAGLTVFPGDSR